MRVFERDEEAMARRLLDCNLCADTRKVFRGRVMQALEQIARADGERSFRNWRREEVTLIDNRNFISFANIVHNAPFNSCVWRDTITIPIRGTNYIIPLEWDFFARRNDVRQFVAQRVYFSPRSESLGAGQPPGYFFKIRHEVEGRVDYIVLSRLQESQLRIIEGYWRKIAIETFLEYAERAFGRNHGSYRQIREWIETHNRLP